MLTRVLTFALLVAAVSGLALKQTRGQAAFAKVVSSNADGVLNDAFCQSCKDLIDAIEGMAEDTAMGYLNEYVPKMCAHLPEFIQQDCNFYILRQADDIFKALRAHEGPETVCKQIKLC